MRRLLLLLLLAALLSLPVAGADVQESLEEALGVEDVEEAGELGPLDELVPTAALQGLLDSIPGSGMLRDAAQGAAGVLLVLLCCAGVDSLFSLREAQLSALNLAGAAALGLLLTGRQDSLMEQSFAAITQALDFGNVLLPVLTSSAAAAGQVTAAAAKYAAAALFLNLLLNGMQLLAGPLIRLYFAAAVAEAASGNRALTGAADLLRWLVTSLLTLLMLAFILYVSLTALTTGSADAAAVKSAKTAVSAAIPVVGGIAADAAGSILAAAAAIRNGVGVYGLLAVLGILLPPFLRAGAGFIVYRAAAALSAGLAPGPLSALAKRGSDALGMLLGCLGACGLMLFFSIYAYMGVWTG